jgi:hypothetical protein
MSRQTAHAGNKHSMRAYSQDKTADENDKAAALSIDKITVRTIRL